MQDIKERFSSLFPFWDKLCGEEQEALCRATSIQEYARGEVVHSGGSCAGLTVVDKGCIRASLLSEEGREITLYRIEAGDFCMLSASCVIEAVTFDVQFTAEEPCVCLILPAGVFASVTKHLPQAEIFALNKTVERFSDVMWVMQQVLFLSLDRRLATFLIDESVRTASDVLSLTHEEIARNIASAREATSRLLKYFEKEGWVALSRGKITLLDRAALRRLT